MSLSLLRRFTVISCFALPFALNSGQAMAQATTIPDAGKAEVETVQFVDATVLDAVHILSVMGGVNIVATKEAGEKEVSLYLNNTNVHSAIDMICRASGLWYRYNKTTNSYLVMTVDQYKEDVVVYREDFTRTFTLRHQNVVIAANTIKNLYGDRVELNLDSDDSDVLGEKGGSAGGSSASNSSTTSSTSNNNRNNTNNGNTGSGTTDQDLRPDNLTPQQLSSLGVSSSGGVDRLTEGALKGIINREPPIYVSVNRLHNILFVRTSDESAMRGIGRLIKDSDKPTPQVLLEMKVLELTIGDSFRSQFNIDLDLGGSSVLDANGNKQASSQINVGNFAAEGGQFLFNFVHSRIKTQLEILDRENRINTLATPMIMASNNRKARLFIGEERPMTTGIDVQTITNNNQTNVFAEPQTTIKSVGDTLEITPRINRDKTVTLHVEQVASDILEDNAEILTVSNGNIVTSTIDTVQSSELKATVIAKDGLTVAIGGMIRRTRNRDNQKVPVLGDVPILGTLFRRDLEDDTKTEIVLLITPHIIMAPEEAEDVSRGRVASLSSNPDIDRYGYGSSDNQPLLPQGATTEDMVALTRYAAQAVRGVPDPLKGVENYPVNLFDPISLMRNPQIDLTPRFAFRRNGLYVTSLLVENRGKQHVTLQEQALRGNWLAVSFENTRLSPPGKANSRTHAYMVSDKPFLDVIATSADLQLVGLGQ